MWLDGQPGPAHALASFEGVIAHDMVQCMLRSLPKMWLHGHPGSVPASTPFEDVAAHGSLHASASCFHLFGRCGCT
eukprot:1274321-Prorocentrum_lima.AAC.1